MISHQRIQMVDLLGQYHRLKPEIMAAIEEVLESSAFINGPQVTDFAGKLAQYTGSAYVIPCGNGTDALQIALMSLNLQPGDEVIVPSFTYVATVEVIALLNLTPVYVDVKPDTFNMDADLLEKAISEKTRAIMTVHLFGQAADMERILSIASKYGLPVIEDNAQALGAERHFSDGSTKQTGTIGMIGTTSFFPSKNLGTYGDGGAMFAQDEKHAAFLRQIANHGQAKKYHHETIGVNSRLDSLHAAILSVKLAHLDDFVNRRRKVATFYDQALSEVKHIELPFRDPMSTHVFHQYTIKVKYGRRDGLKQFLESAGIPSMIYYPIPQHLQKAYINERFKEGSFPVSESLCHEVLSLPIHTEMDEKQTEYITDHIIKFFT